MIDPHTLKVTELKAELTARGLPTKGLKKDLVTRLEEALATEGTTAAPAESTSEPDVAPKDVDDEGNPDMAHRGANQDEDITSINQESENIVNVSEPVAEPLAVPAETDIITDPVPVPASEKESVTLPEPCPELTTLKPANDTPDLLQEGLVDTTMTSVNASADASSTGDTKKRPHDQSEDPLSGLVEKGTTTTSTPAKKLKSIINREENEKVIAAAKESVEADARRRSTAPSPSPISTSARELPSSTASIPIISATIEKKSPILNTSPSASTSPIKTTKSEPGRRSDMRSVMERQIKLAAFDRNPTTQPAHDISTSDVVSTEEPKYPNATRALAITNFVRPLTVNQVKRMLSEFGETEVLWMDSIRTHCYVIFKDTAAAQKAYAQVDGQVFPKETGRPLEPHFITPEAATRSIEAAEEAQKNGKKPVVYKGGPVAPKLGAPISIRKDDVEVIFKRDKVEQTQVVQPAELFKMTKTQPALYYKPVKEPPVAPVGQQIVTTSAVTLPSSAAVAAESN
ncbi:Apoptotic chromatin condensation inducer in the nucleus [Lobosporangium transversale]|nr:Apoptotic chromatin condensation inducer in the nucleus [Lobosporangium transversale]